MRSPQAASHKEQPRYAVRRSGLTSSMRSPIAPGSGSIKGPLSVLNSMPIFLDGHGPLFRQVHRALRDAIAAGTFPPATRLPPTRDVAAELGVARSTVLLAYEQLAAEGYVRARQGSGTYVQGGSPP